MREEEEKRQKEKTFMRGVYCGVLLTLACMALSVTLYHIRVQRRINELQGVTSRTTTEESQTQPETESVLELDYSALEKKMKEMQTIINDNFLDGIDARQVEDGIYAGMMAGLADPYAYYYPKQDVQEVTDAAKGVYSGIGATLTEDAQTGEIVVVSCYEGTPAEEAGLLPGDVLTGVNGESAGDWDMTELIEKIRSEPGDAVTLQILRDGQEMELSVERRSIEIQTVTYTMLDDSVGYLKITEFDQVTVEQFKKAMEALDKENMERLIIDLRGNPGGVLDAVCKVLDELLPEGLIVYTEDKAGHRTEYFSNGKKTFDRPLAVLIDGNSASASEIFAGAVKDYGLGTLVGTTTFGKGIVQRMYSLSDGSGLEMTIARYYTPKGNNIHEKGIDPDVEVALDESLIGKTDVKPEEDNQLQEALRIVREMPETQEDTHIE